LTGIAETEDGIASAPVNDIVAGKGQITGRFSPGAIAMDFTEFDLPARTVASTQSEMTEIILPNDANTMGNLLGGRLMHFIDLTGALAAYRHVRTNLVTAAMDHIDFIVPAHVGDMLNLKSSVNRAFKTSVEVGVKVWVEHPQSGERLHAASAYLVYVSVDRDMRPLRVPQAIPETPDEMRRYADAQLRREHRESEAARHKEERRATARLNADADMKGYL
jgi:acyl-CoA hydrolase